MERKGDKSLYFMDRILALLVGSVMDEAHASSLRYLSKNEIESSWILSLNFQGQSNNSKEWNSGDDQLRLRWMIYLVVLADAAEKGLYGGKCRSPVLWAEIGESSFTGLELKGIVHFRKKGKLAPRYVGPFEILEWIGLVAFRLRLPEELSKIMDQEIKKLKRKKIALVKVRWNSKRGPEFTWEHEDQMRIKYP
ncbi:hypothetical protein Tco_0633936 [Tanacetum coccineum]